MSETTTPAVSFGGLEVVAFESRQAKEMATLIERLGGVPLVAPSMREVPLQENPAAFEFAEKLFAGRLDAVIFMTGVGTRALFEVLETRHAREKIVHSFSEIAVVARGPKPVKVLREYQIPVTLTVPEPNTWREILQALDKNSPGLKLKDRRIAIQEYGVSNLALVAELKSRGAELTLVPVYRWTLPEDLAPLEKAVESIVAGNARVVLFTNGVQVDHAVQVASKNGMKERFVEALTKCVVCSVGPTCSEFIRGQHIQVDLEPEHPKMGALVHEGAKRAADILRQKRNGKAASSGSRPSPISRARASATTPTDQKGDSGTEVTREPWANSLFMKACRLEATDATPVWLMRQAGRYMKSYRELRARVPFLELCKSPDLVTEITVTAAEKIGADAAIIFADLLLIAEPLGFGLEYDRGEGPVVRPVLRENKDVGRLREVEPAESLGYLFEAIRQTRAVLSSEIPLIGFAGAPFTLASYLIEGGASKNYLHTKSLMHRDPGAWRALMEHLARNLAKYVNSQIMAGVQAVQIFDTWAGCLAPADYREFAGPYTRMLIRGITPGVPVIHFGTGTGLLLEDMRDAGGDIIGLDFRVELDQAWNRLGADVGVQGNLDPVVLFAEPSYIRQRAQRILDQAAARHGHIFNLGHGILPDTPMENVIALVEMVHELSDRR
ncbi:MAG TPA: uroporphyrinogen decarboxylase [Terriglobia bacterium]|nr:uroporphyrinogen decarboxylase [Terriglobia bacterium]